MKIARHKNWENLVPVPVRLLLAYRQNVQTLNRVSFRWPPQEQPRGLRRRALSIEIESLNERVQLGATLLGAETESAMLVSQSCIAAALDPAADWIFGRLWRMAPLKKL